jgi:DNA-binding NtrC family response regulator
MSDTGNTTSPADPAERLRSSDPSGAWVPAFVIGHCIPEPGRAGEVALVDPKARGPFVIGRAGVHFFRQRPGEMVDCGRLKGETISGEQLVVSNEGDGLRVHNVGRAPVFVDGSRLPRDTSVHALPGTVVEVYGHSVFLLTLRPLSMPEPHRLLLPMHPFGEPDSMRITGESPAIWKLRQAVARAATSTGHVLLYGQSGTGKNVVARAIHDKSVRARGPFTHVNCSTLRLELSALTLFGGRKGWPNPGTQATIGYFAASEGGTLFLDEIGEMEPRLQSDLLSALECGYTVVPDPYPTPTRCVVIAATNRGDLGMKDDVRYRFGTLIVTPTLDERREDIALLVSHLLLTRARTDTEFARSFLKTDASGRDHVPVDASLIAGLLRYPLPGNVRGLDFVLGRAADETPPGQPLGWPGSVPKPPDAKLEIRQEGPHVTADALVRGLDAPRTPTVAPPVVRVREDDAPPGKSPLPTRERVLEVLVLGKYNYVKAAAMLGITVDQLFRLRKKYGID